MDNESFRKLYASDKPASTGDKEKTTKEIAREAVEEEFTNKRRRGRFDRQGYGSDSGGSSDEDDTRRHKQKDEPPEENPDEPGGRKRRKTEEYRDRARERREGKGGDYEHLNISLTQNAAELDEEGRRKQAELSRYLGGDEAHTHLVKGLDKALAEKVRREVNGTKDEDLDKLLEDGSRRSRPESERRARAPRTELGRSMQKYLARKEEAAKESRPLAGGILHQQYTTNQSVRASIRRSILTFSLDADVRKFNKAWEAPKAVVQSSFSVSGGPSLQATDINMKPLNKHLIATIGNKLRGAGDKSLPCYAKKEEKIKDDNGSDSSDDDDIFSDDGSLPSASKKDEGRQEPPTKKDDPQKKGSIFDHLLPESSAATQKLSLAKHTPHDSSNKKRVINRDVFGAGEERSNVMVDKRRGPKTAKSDGVSLSAYVSGYGEELDTDFAGMNDAEKKKPKADEEEGGEKADDEWDD